MEETELTGNQLASTMWLAWLGVRQKEKERPYTVQRSAVNRLSERLKASSQKSG